MKFVPEEGLAQRLFDLTLASLCALPTWKPDQAHDLVDVRDHALDHDGRRGGLDFVEQRCQGRFAPILVLFGRDLLLSVQGLIGELQQLLEELHTIDLAGLEAVLQCIEPL